MSWWSKFWRWFTNQEPPESEPCKHQWNEWAGYEVRVPDPDVGYRRETVGRPIHGTRCLLCDATYEDPDVTRRDA